jgi:hypothetical protein
MLAEIRLAGYESVTQEFRQRGINYRHADVALSKVWDFRYTTVVSDGSIRPINRVPLRQEAVPMQELPETVFRVLNFNRNKVVSGYDKTQELLSTGLQGI